jgi:hypothetical protein
VQLPYRNRYRLTSLLNMLQFSAEEWTKMIRELDRLSSVLLGWQDVVAALMDGQKEKVTDPLQRIVRSCVILRLDFSASYAEELIQRIERSVSGVERTNALLMRFRDPHSSTAKLDETREDALKIDIAAELGILKKRVDDELKGRQFLALEPSKTRYYGQRHQFGERVSDNFHSANRDIEEAGNCFALDRYTACVFHLMRVMEVALRVTADTLNDPSINPKTNPSWDSILKKFRQQLEKPSSLRADEWKTDEVFFSGVAATLMAVKDAWRNPTMHVDSNYDEERALDILNAVGAFMRHVAEKLHD